jgi:hypothetical protein
MGGAPPPIKNKMPRFSPRGGRNFPLGRHFLRVRVERVERVGKSWVVRLGLGSLSLT